MEGEAIKSFLVGLGFGVDDNSLQKFNKALASATLKVAALYTTTQVMAAGITAGIAGISKDFEEIGYQYRLIAPAINRAMVLRQALFKAYSAAGTNLVATIQNAIKLNYSLIKTRYAFEAIYKSVAAKFFPLLTRQSDIFRERLFKYMPKIQQSLERFVFFIFKAFAATVQLGERVWSILSRIYDFFTSLSKETDGWSTIILAVVAAWKILNLSFLATPLGALIAGLTTLIVLWDDLKTFAEGGESLINWGSRGAKIFTGLATVLGGLVTILGAVRVAMIALDFLALLNPIGLIIAAFTALGALLVYLDAKYNILRGDLANFFGGIGDKVLSWVTGTHLENGVKNAQGFYTMPNPVGSNVQNNSNSQVSQRLQQQTNITVSGSADASQVGKAVAGEQARVNSDMARNFQSPTR